MLITEQDLDQIFADNQDLARANRKANQANPLPRLAEAIAQKKERKHEKRESEGDFLSWVIDYAHLKGWLAAHFRPAKTEAGWRTAVQGDAGFLDLVLARNGVVIIAELKSEIGTLSPPQEAWLAALQGDGESTALWFVWRPSDREQIERILE